VIIRRESREDTHKKRKEHKETEKERDRNYDERD
jgi:hypothetical protein